jgi:hypothetical protein
MVEKKLPKKTGRKPKEEPQGQVFIRAPEKLLLKLDEAAARLPDSPGRPEFVRRVLEAFVAQGWELHAEEAA